MQLLDLAPIHGGYLWIYNCTFSSQWQFNPTSKLSLIQFNWKISGETFPPTDVQGLKNIFYYHYRISNQKWKIYKANATKISWLFSI